MRNLGGLVVVALAACAARADDDAFDLRGPAPQKGARYTTLGVLKVAGADARMKRGDAVVKFKLDLTVALEAEVTLLEVAGRDVTKFQRKLLKDRTETAGLAKAAQIEPSVLEHETVVGAFDGKAWKHSLAAGKPLEAQSKALGELDGLADRDAPYPGERVKVGHKWTADANGLDTMLSHTLADVRGKLDRRFVKVEMLDGEPVAVVGSLGKVSGKMKGNGDQPPTAEVELSHTAWKSLKTGLVVQETFTGTLSVKATSKDGDAVTELVVTGPIRGDSTTKPVGKK